MARQRQRKGDPVHGWLALDKPRDVTSTQAVGILKRLFNAQKTGHGGTLDPLADGILPIAFGEATKTSAWAMDAEKEYVFTVTWGTSTASQDAEGEVIATSDARPEQADIEAWLADFHGDIEQIPPKYSAIKVDGERAYDLARGGEDFELKGRQVTVFATHLVNADADSATIHVRSGKGFYVRAMARDLAFDLGCEGHITALRRTRVGVLDEAISVSLADVEALADDRDALLNLLQPLQIVLGDIPAVDITPVAKAEIAQGRTVMLLPHVVEQWRMDRSDDEGDRRAYAVCNGGAVALGEVRAGQFQPSKVFQI